MQSPIKIHGGKGMLVSKLLPLIPQHQTYLEPFAGGASVLFAKNYEDVNEVLCDASGEISGFYKVIRDPFLFAQFSRLVETTIFHGDFFESSAILPQARAEIEA